MSFAVAVLFIAVLVVAGVCLLFVFHPQYEAGVLGVAGLAFVAVAAVSRLDGIIEDPASAYISPRSMLMWVGVAMFLGQLAWRFWRRCKARCDDWRDAGKCPAVRR